MKSNINNIIEDVTISNKITGDSYKGSIIADDEIDGNPFWIFSPAERPNHILKLAKEYYSVKYSKKGKNNDSRV